MKTLILSTLTAATLVFANADSAQAGKFQLVIGNGGYGNQGLYQPGYGGGFGGGYGGGAAPILYDDHGHDHGYGQPVWHDTTHLDYIPGRWVQHGCHRHWIPGRYVVHQDGHWDAHP